MLYSLEIWVTFTNFNIYRPQIYENNGARKLMFPQEARLRNFTYSASMMVDLEIKIVRRFGKKLSQMDVATKIGISLVAYQLIERGVTKNPKPRHLKKLETVLNSREDLEVVHDLNKV